MIQVQKQNKSEGINRMYSSFKNHSNNLQYCERFYNNAYEYYNDYERPQDYEDDLSKLFFKCKRKTMATFWAYHNPNNEPFAQNRAIRMPDNNEIFSKKTTATLMLEQSIQNEMAEQLQMAKQPHVTTMQQFLNPFVQIYHQNNFSDFKNDLQQNKNKHKIIYFPQDKLIKHKASSQRGKNYNVQLDFIQHLMDTFDTKTKFIKQLEADDKIDIHDASFYACQLAFEAFNLYELDSLLKNKEESPKIISTYNLFKTMIETLLDEMCDSDSWSHLILYVPKIPILNYFFNPLVAGIYSFLRKEESLSKSDYQKTEQAERELPKIVLINLDSRQTPQNIRTIHQCSAIGLMYITIYNESLHHEEIEDEEDEISQMVSKLLIKEIDETNKDATQDKRNKGKNYTEVPKIFAFPLNSKYIKRYMRQKYGPDADVNCTLTGTSEDIMFLFENVLFEEIRNFCPNIIMINYNGSLHVNEENFSKIIRTLTIISDHRIVLFPNFCNLFEIPEEASLKVPSSEFIEEKGLNDETLSKVKSYIEKYQELDISQLDLHTMFNNMAMFLKISSGTYSFQQRPYSSSSVFQKYQTGLKYEYLERLAQIDEFKYYSKFVSKHLKGSSLMKLMERERKECIQKNADNVPLYKDVVEEAITEIWSESERVPKNIKYKLKKISRSLDDNEIKLQKYFELKKDRLLIETIKNEKIKKAYYVKAAARDNEPDSLYVYKFRQHSEDRQQVLLESYSQVFFQEQPGGKHLNVFVVNVRDDNDNLTIMYGQTRLNGYEVYLAPVREQRYGEEGHKEDLSIDTENPYMEYINYSHAFYHNTLYLFWPYEWDLKLEVQCLIAGVEYNPRVINKMLRINLQVKDNLVNVWYEPIIYDPKFDFIPKMHAGAWAQNQNQIFVFGGICDDQNDFHAIDSGVYAITIDKDHFWAQNIPKKVNTVKIRPKLNYIVDQKEENILQISGGHGREFTNFFNVFSYHTYEFNSKTYEISVKKISRKVIHLPKPMFTRKQGRFDMAKDRGTASNVVKVEQRISNEPKYKFIMCRKGFYSDKEASKSSAITFLDDDYTTTTYNKESSFSRIFSSNKTFKNIYSQSFCSPEIYVWDKSRDLIRIEILVEVSKQVNEYSMKEYIFPNEDSLIALCVHSSHEKIYLLAKSAIYTRNAYILYEGSIKNTDQIAGEKQLKMRIFFEFKASVTKLQEKAIYSQDHRLMICGGNLNNAGARQDFLLEHIRGKYKLKTVKLLYSPKPSVVEMPNPYILESLEDDFEMYSVSMNAKEKWIIRLEQFVLGRSNRSIKQSEINLNTIHDGHIYKVSPKLMKLSFLNVSRYSRFSYEYLKGKSHALLIEINKLQQEVDLNDLEKEIKVKVLMFLLKSSYEAIESKFNYIYMQFKRFIAFIIKEKAEDTFYLEKSMLAWEIILILVNYRIEQGFLSSLNPDYKKMIERVDLYKFILQDKSRPLTKYVGLSPLGTTRIKFFQIKTRRPIVSNMVSSMGGEDQYGINIGEKSCNEIYFDDISNYKNDIECERKNQWIDSEENVYQVESTVTMANQA